MSSIPNSVRTAGFILLALMTYFVVRGIMADNESDNGAAAAAEVASTEKPIPEAIISPALLSSHEVSVVLKGRTEPDREVTVRSETMGTVINAQIQEGQNVRRGALLCGLDLESRAARVDEAMAGVESARIDHEAASQLEEKGWTTSNRSAATKASLDRAQAALAAAKIELGKTRIAAPFAGVFESRLAERGDFLAVGAPCGRLVDLDPIIVAVDATEDQLGALNTENDVAVELATGTSASGKIRYVARTANSQTRTFRIEVEVPNPDLEIAAGLTATVKLGFGEAPALLLTPASLVLHDDGRVGVRYVDNADTIQFAEVTVIDDAPDGIWVTGIPAGVNLLVAGQDYLREGIKVTTRSSQGL